MKPKEKAQELVDKYSNYTTDWDYLIKAKLCTLITVDEIINITSESYDIEHINFWQEVKKEIAKM